MNISRVSSVLLILLFSGCGDQHDSEVVRWDASERLPQSLADFHLFNDIETLEASSGSVVYEPKWPLWSNGTGKVRQFVEPTHASINKENHNAWSFALGTLFFKTFSDQLGPIETRVIRNTEEGWEYAVYQWNLERNGAVRLDGRLPLAVDVMIDNEKFQHEIPSLTQCKTCHESGPSVILGYNAVQLEEEPLSSGTDDALTNQVIGYAYGNCAHCHNGSQLSDESSFSLLPDVFIANTVNQVTEGSGSVDGIRIKPGYPDQSVLYLAISGNADDDELRSMPPLGVQLRDEELVTLLETWISHLK